MAEDKIETHEPVPRSSPPEIQQLQCETEISIEMVNWFSSIAAASSKPLHRLKPRIQRVPHWLKNIGSNAECFEPLVVSFGPIHSNKPHLQQMDQLKAPFMDMFASDCKVSYQDLYNKVASVLDEAKDCYEASTLNGLDDTSFCQMMCLDGCFILWYMYLFTSRKWLKINEIVRVHDILHVVRDLFLLENQIPFVILTALMSFRTEEDELFTLLFEFQNIPQFSKDAEYRHVLDILMLRRLPRVDASMKPIHLLDLIRSMSVGQYSILERGTETISGKWCSYRSAKELKAVGIRFRKAKGLSPQLKEVSFKNNLLSSATLFLPQLCVDYHTKSKLLNMAAYEACPDALSEMEVTSYICFMNELIDEADDVKVLRSKGVLINQIGSDQLVADLFNEIANGLVHNPNIYNEVRRQIDTHYKNKWYAWIAHWTHKYLSTPWTVCGLLAAVIIILLTAIQTVFAVFPRPN